MNKEELIKLLSLRRVKIRQDEIHASCPFSHLHASGEDKNPSFSINVDKGVYNCFACGSTGTLEELLSERMGITISKALDILDDLGFSPVDVSYDKLLRKEEEDDDEILSETVLLPFKKIEEVYEMYEGTVEGRDSIIYAVRDVDKNLVGGLARSKEGRHHKILWGIKKSHYLCGEHEVEHEKELVVVEGPKDMLSIKKSGWNNVVSIMGAEVSKRQLEKLIWLSSNFIVWLDRDKAGMHGVLRFIKGLEPLGQVRYVDPYESLTKTEKDAYDVFYQRGPGAVLSIINEAKSLLELELVAN